MQPDKVKDKRANVSGKRCSKGTWRQFIQVSGARVDDPLVGGTKNTNFQNSIGALSNPISFDIRISKQFLFSF